MAHNWKIVLGGAGQIIGEPLHDLIAMKSVKLLLHPILLEDWFTRPLHFSFISLIVAYDTYEDLVPIYRRISRRYNSLPLVVRVKMSDVCDPDPAKVYNLLLRATIMCLLHVAARYKLPTERLEKILSDANSARAPDGESARSVEDRPQSR